MAGSPTPYSSARAESLDLLRHVRGRRRSGRALILLVTVLLVGNALIGERGLVALLRAQRESAIVSKVIDALRIENAELREHVRELREEPGVIEELARGELGLIEDGELIFIVADVADDYRRGVARVETDEVDDD